MHAARTRQIDRMRGSMGPLSPEHEMSVEGLPRRIINKVVQKSITTLKTAAREAEATTVIDVVRRLFKLHDKEKGAAANGESSGEKKA
jgi:glutamyl-tRNA reductase